MPIHRVVGHHDLPALRTVAGLSWDQDILAQTPVFGYEIANSVLFMQATSVMEQQFLTDANPNTIAAAARLGV